MRVLLPGSTLRIMAFLVVSSVLVACSLQDATPHDQPAATYDQASGRLKELAFDTTRNGRNDAIGFMDGTRVHRIEVDEDEDGKVDRWEFYDSKRRLERVGFSRLHSGVPD